MAIMKHPVPPRPELGVHDGLAYALFVPEEEPTAGVVICHGAGLRTGRLEGFRADRQAIEPWLESVSLLDAAASLAPETALLLLHAQGDEQVPYTVSEELYAAAGDPKRLLIFPGGHHRSLQHDMEVQATSLRFIENAVRRRAAAR
jgi:fermentation-respiration switch protein FrsA (DUF1100 family)